MCQIACDKITESFETNQTLFYCPAREANINRKFAFLIDGERSKSEGITLDEYCSFIFRYKLGTQQIVFNYVYFYVKWREKREGSQKVTRLKISTV